jgi:hypothetical protein
MYTTYRRFNQASNWFSLFTSPSVPTNGSVEAAGLEMAVQSVTGGAMDVLSSSIVSALGYTGAVAGTGLLYHMYGGPITRSVTDTVNEELQQFQQRQALTRKNSAHHHANAAQGSGGRGRGSTPAQWLGWERAGASQGAVASILKMPSHSLGIQLLIFGTFLTYLHAQGAYEIKKQLKGREVRERFGGKKTRQVAAGAPSGQNVPLRPDTVPPELDQSRMKEQCEWDDLALLDAKQTMLKDMLHEKGVGIETLREEEEDGFIDSALREMYTKDSFYDPNASPPGHFIKLQTPNPVRMIINIMLGFIMQMNVFLVGRTASSPSRRQGKEKEEEGVDKTHHTDTLRDAARLIAVWAYWELFVHAIRQHGWGPVYVATQHVVALLTSGARRS